VADSHQSLNGSQAHAFKVMRESLFSFGRVHDTVVFFAAGLAAISAEPSLVSVATEAVFDEFFSAAL
jgi:hypothetical protein